MFIGYSLIQRYKHGIINDRKKKLKYYKIIAKKKSDHLVHISKINS